MKTDFSWVYSQLPQRSGAGATATTTDASGSGEGISDRISQAFDAASTTTGTSFQYLLDTAQRESALKPDAKAKTSSATGLFQFIESTWLETMKSSGAELGLGQYADQITKGANGRYTVADPAVREKILALRNDPEVASLMAGAYTRKNADYLEDKLGRGASAGELYIAHFLGAKGASQLISSAESSPSSSAADLFPKQAKANKSIFYDNGRERSVSEVYASLVAQHGNDAPMVPAGSQRVMTAFAALGVQGASSSASDSSALGYADQEAAGWRAAEPTDAFSALFRNDTTSNPVAAAAFWKGFSQNPAMFDVAMAEDNKAASATDSTGAALSAVLRASQPGQILDTSRRHGPLDLGSFLKEE